jgi:hypothetical protein
MADVPIRTTTQKIQLFRRFFTGRLDVYGTYDPTSGHVRQVKRPVTDQVLLAHLQGRQSYGVYLLVEDRTRAVAADFDIDDLERPMQFVRTAVHYGLAAYIERSKSKGYHAWIFFPPDGVPACKARAMVCHMLAEMHAEDTEVFPKQDSLDSSRSYGNFINAPLFGRCVPQGRTAFVDPANPSQPAPDQWAVLEAVQVVTETQLDELIALNDIPPARPTRTVAASSKTAPADRTFGLPPCARQMLSEGVTQCQRISCFRLAVHLRKAGLPCDLAIATLHAWAQKNRPDRGKRIITSEEIVAQTHGAYRGSFKGAGCEEPIVAAHCHPSCPLLGAEQKAKPADTEPLTAGTSVRHPTSRSSSHGPSRA